ncbi:MAG: methyltransferase domain-containing protein [Pseudomonadota bacterium]|nr:methyltransferase domain-containing protein [Pseudomonadota bacterium]
MSSGQHPGELGEVYAAGSSTKIAEIYDRWSSTYDNHMEQVGYRHPAICVSLFSRYVPVDGQPLLDAGVGTGLIGELMRLIGYSNIDGIDISQGMLERARAKDIYAGLHVADMTRPLALPDSHYRGIISCGVFTNGHVGVEGLVPLIDVCMPGGHIVTTVKSSIWDGGFAFAVHELSAAGRLRLVEQTDPYVSMPGEPGTIPGLAVVLERL